MMTQEERVKALTHRLKAAFPSRTMEVMLGMEKETGHDVAVVVIDGRQTVHMRLDTLPVRVLTQQIILLVSLALLSAWAGHPCKQFRRQPA